MSSPRKAIIWTKDYRKCPLLRMTLFGLGRVLRMLDLAFNTVIFLIWWFLNRDTLTFSALELSKSPRCFLFRVSSARVSLFPFIESLVRWQLCFALLFLCGMNRRIGMNRIKSEDRYESEHVTKTDISTYGHLRFAIQGEKEKCRLREI